MKNKRTLGFLLALLLLTATFTSNAKKVLAATVSTSGYDSVDSGGHLDYDLEDNTKYGGWIPRCVNTWNAYKPGVIRKDAWNTVADLGFSDVNWTDTTIVGYYVNSGYSAIYFNTFYMDTFTNGEVWNVITHELGHALGLDENEPKDVMAPNVNGVYELTANDKASYDAAALLY